MRIFAHNLVRRPSWEFVKFISWTARHQPSELPEAIAHAVKLRHFESLTKAAVAAHRYPTVVASLAERFQAQVERLRGNAEERLRELAHLEQRFARELEHRYNQLHSEFRSGVAEVKELYVRRFQEFIQSQRALMCPRGL